MAPIAVPGDVLICAYMGPLFERPAVRASVDKLLQDVLRERIRVVIERAFTLSQAAAHDFAERTKPLGRVVMKP